MLSDNNLCKQFGPRSGPTKCRALSGPKLLGTLMLFLKEFFEKLILKKKKKKQTPAHNTKAWKINQLTESIDIVPWNVFIVLTFFFQGYIEGLTLMLMYCWIYEMRWVKEIKCKACWAFYHFFTTSLINNTGTNVRLYLSNNIEVTLNSSFLVWKC